MPSIKMKTHKGVKKRFKVSANGKVRHKRCGSSHLNSHKSGKQIRRLRKKATIKTNTVARKLRRALGEPVVAPTGGRPELLDLAAGSPVEAAASGPAVPAES